MPWPFDDKPVAYRASMLPIGNYEDGSIAFPVWPQGAVDAKNAFARFHRGESPQPEDAVLAGLAMTGAGAFGLGRSAVSRGSVAGAERAEASSGLPSVSFRGGVDSFGRGNYEALVGDTPVGRAYARDLGENIQLGQLNIDAPYQRQGIGTALQKHIEADMGKSAVPDTYLSNAEYQRWKKTAPQVVSNYKQTDSGSWMGTPSSGLPSHSVEAGRLSANPPEAAPAGFIPAAANAERQPVTARVYRGVSSPGEQWPPTNPRHNVFWASDNPEVAASYTSEALRHGGDAAAITPADVTFQNPMVVNAGGKRWDRWNSDGQFSSNELVRQARNAGHDGLIIQQVQDGLNGVVPSATTYAALKPGTVKSATTGETLFSNPKDVSPAGLLATGEGENPQQDFMLELLRRHGFRR